MKRVCVFCGSSPGNRRSYREAAVALADALVARDLELVYGGARVGLMGDIADAVLARGGRAIGVIPRSMMDRELAHTGLTDLRVVESMHERKALMTELSDGFVALPGAYGTLDELAESLTWRQLDIHPSPIGLLDVDGYYQPLLAFFDRAVADGFLRAPHRDLLLVDTSPATLLERMATTPAHPVSKWWQVPPRA